MRITLIVIRENVRRVARIVFSHPNRSRVKLRLSPRSDCRSGRALLSARPPNRSMLSSALHRSERWSCREADHGVNMTRQMPLVNIALPQTTRIPLSRNPLRQVGQISLVVEREDRENAKKIAGLWTFEWVLRRATGSVIVMRVNCYLDYCCGEDRMMRPRFSNSCSSCRRGHAFNPD
jgi:hypothetical protein